MNKTARNLFLLALGAFAAWPVVAAAQAADIDTELREIRQGQAEIKKDLEEIKKLLAPRQPQPQIEKIASEVSIGGITSRGRADAPVTMIEFSDYQCPYCKRHVDQTVPELVKQYVDSGKVRYVFRDFPIAALHPQAGKAAEAARCAGDQGKYWEMHDRIFANQKELNPEKLLGHAKSIGLDEAAFRTCVDQGVHAAAVQKDIEEASRLGIRGTPAVIVGLSDGSQVKQAVMIRGAHPVATFKAEIDKLLALTVR